MLSWPVMHVELESDYETDAVLCTPFEREATAMTLIEMIKPQSKSNYRNTKKSSASRPLCVRRNHGGNLVDCTLAMFAQSTAAALFVVPIYDLVQHLSRTTHMQDSCYARM